jgi:hypothetical protein
MSGSNILLIKGRIQKFPDWVDNEKYTLTTVNTRWEATQKASSWSFIIVETRNLAACHGTGQHSLLLAQTELQADSYSTIEKQSGSEMVIWSIERRNFVNILHDVQHIQETNVVINTLL